MSLPACPNCHATSVEQLSRDSDELIVCAACGFGSRGEWPNPDAGHSDDPYAAATRRPSSPADTGAGGAASPGMGMVRSGGGAGGFGRGMVASGGGDEDDDEDQDDAQQGSSGGQTSGSTRRAPVSAVRGALRKMLKAALVIAMGWVLLLLMVFATIGFFTSKLLDVPGLRPAASVLTRIACLGGHGSQTACQIHDILSAFKDVGAEDALRNTWDCSNLKPGEDRSTCDTGAIAQMDGVLAIPKKDRWMIAVYIRAASKYDVPWEVLAALHGANTNFGGDGDCSNASGHGGGMYDFSTSTWDKFKVDAGEEYHTDDNHCWTPNPKTHDSKDAGGSKITIETYVTYRDTVDESPGFLAHEDPRDMVDSTFTMARLLAAKHAKGQYTWDYNGDDAGSCAPNKPVDGSLYAPPTLATSGASATITDGSTLAGGDASVFDDLINQKSAKYNIPPAVMKGFVEQESNFNPNAGSSAGAQGLGQFMPNTFTGISDPATGKRYLLSQIKDPERNLDATGRYISGLLNEFHGNLTLAASAYNSGPDQVHKAGDKVPPFAETQEYAYAVPARIIKYGGWGDQIHFDTRYVNQRFEDAQLGHGDFNGHVHRDPGLHRLAYPIGSLTKANSPGDAKGFGYHGTVTAAAPTPGASAGGSSDLQVGAVASANVSVSTPAGPWTGTEKFTGKVGTDKVSRAVRYRAGPDHSPCYVAIVNAWYQALTGVADGSGDAGGGGTGMGLDQAAGLQMGPAPGMPEYAGGAHVSPSNDIRYEENSKPPRSIAAYNTLGMNRNVPPKGNSAWDCSSFAGYVLWIGGGVNIIAAGGDTNGEWAAHTNVLDFQSGQGTKPIGGFQKGDLVWYNSTASHIEVVKDAHHTWNWGGEPGHINGDLDNGGRVPVAWLRPLHLKDQAADAAAAGGAIDPAKLAKTDKALEKIGVVQEPLNMDETRLADTAAYSQRHYGVNSSALNPSMIVLHYTAGTGDPFSIFAPEKPVKGGGAPELPNVSAHFVVLQNGTIKQFVPINVMARHVIGLNNQAIGIEMEEAHGVAGIFARKKQITAVLTLVRTLQTNLGIDDAKVIGHGMANDDPNYEDKLGQKNDHRDWTGPEVVKLRKLL
jgi:hypothetical protein